MTEAEAKQEAAKREKNKSKHMTNKEWRAVHTEEKGWHPALVDSAAYLYAQGRQKARDAFFNGGTVGDFQEACNQMLLATCQRVTDEFEGRGQTRQ